MLRKHSHDEPEPPKDIDIERWFQALGEPPVAQEPPGARFRMLARIEQRRKQRWGLSWLSPSATPALAIGFAAGLLLAFGLSLWSGHGIFGLNRQGIQHVVATRTGLPTYRLPTRIPFSKELTEALGTQVAKRIPDGTAAPVIGFMPQAQRTTFFRIGRRYADALAALHSGAADTANQHLTWLAQALTNIQAPAPLSQYIDVIQTQIREQPSQIDQWRFILAGFESFYHDAYTTTTPAAASLLFELGTWSESLYLAAATGDLQGVKQGRAAHQDVQRTLQPLNLPPESLELLGQLLALIDKPNLSVSDLTAVRSQVQAIQDLLSQ